MVILLQLLGQFCVLYLPIKRGKAAEETVAFSTHRGKHRVSAAGSGTGKPQPNKQVRKKDPSQGHGAQYVCLSLHYFDASTSEAWWCTGHFKRALHKINSKVPGKITVHQARGFFPFLSWVALPSGTAFLYRKAFEKMILKYFSLSLSEKSWDCLRFHGLAQNLWEGNRKGQFPRRMWEITNDPSLRCGTEFGMKGLKGQTEIPAYTSAWLKILFSF